MAIPEMRVRLLRLPAGFEPVESSAPHGPPPRHEQPGRPRGSGNQVIVSLHAWSLPVFFVLFSLVNSSSSLVGSFAARHNATDLVGSPCQRINEAGRYFCLYVLTCHALCRRSRPVFVIQECICHVCPTLSVSLSTKTNRLPELYSNCE
jgi:hypothetical protein